MKNKPLYAVFQDKPHHSYWATNIHEGICDTAHDFGDIICPLELHALPPDLQNKNVLLVGNSQRWLKSAIPILTANGATPIIVNASMISDRSIRYSGVIFELEETLDSCLQMLKSEGREHTVLLGLSPDSVTDHVKANAFARPNDTVWANGPLDDCVQKFADQLRESNCDSVICANDTVAIFLIRCLLERNIAVPESLFVIGMGNSYLGAELAIPLSSIMFDYREMGVEAVRLYHKLAERASKSHLTVSLPCHLVVRESAPFKNEYSYPAETIEFFSQSNSQYFLSQDTQNVIAIESLFQSGDAIDREILFGIARGESSEQLAKRLFFTDRAVRYRISKIIQKNDYPDREALENALRHAILYEYRKDKKND